MLEAKVLRYVGPPVATALVVFGVYSWGHHNGSKAVQAKWDTESQEHALQVARLEGKVQFQEKDHAQKSAAIQQELETARQTYERRLAEFDAEYTQRLRNSEERSRRYSDLAKGGATECRSLASHATGLDQSLEEGRRLVKEFRATIEQRDAQLKLLGEQIITDRELLSE